LDLGCGPADITIRFARRYPSAKLVGVDGSPAMLQHGRRALEQSGLTQSGLTQRIQLIQGYLPGAQLPHPSYDAVISNSLLHHLKDPAVLWQSVVRYAKPGAPVFVMDLLRPDDEQQAQALVNLYAADEQQVLRKDFHSSLLAAYRETEVRQQLEQNALSGLEQRVVSDRHFIVFGRVNT
jgi:ubiquinone/menaquinone biosynthesis C-methylase UbiE